MKKKRVMLKVGDSSYPCYETMGGNVLFEEESGLNVLKGIDFEGMTATLLCLFFWSRCKGACKREGIDFPFDRDQFVDAVDGEDLIAAINEMAGVESDGPESPEVSDDSKKA